CLFAGTDQPRLPKTVGRRHRLAIQYHRFGGATRHQLNALSGHIPEDVSDRTTILAHLRHLGSKRLTNLRSIATAFRERLDLFEVLVPTIHHLERLNSYGVTFHSYTEPHLCADNEMVRGILLAVLATMAKQEAKRLSERVIAGMRKAAAKGTKSGNPIGRPRVDAKTE